MSLSQKLVNSVLGACVCSFVPACSGTEAVESDVAGMTEALVLKNDFYFVSDNIQQVAGKCEAPQQTNPDRVAKFVGQQLAGNSAKIAMTEANNCSGKLSEYRDVFAPMWEKYGIPKDSIWAAPGNHDYIDNTNGYKAYGYKNFFLYSSTANTWGYFPLGDRWTVFKLDSNKDKLSPAEMKAQVDWLVAKMDQFKSTRPCIIAYYHHPIACSGTRHTGERDYAKDLWDKLASKATLVLSGHEHMYELIERSGEPVQIVAGTGGAELLTSIGTPVPGSQQRLLKYGPVKISTNGAKITTAFYDATGSTSATPLHTWSGTCRTW